MKRFISASLFSFLVISINSLYSQTIHEISGHIGVGINGLYGFAPLDGGGSSEGGLSISGGVHYGYSLSNRLKLISGLDYSGHRFTLVSAPLPEQYRLDGEVSILSVPIHIRWDIGNWFFIHGGPDVDMQLVERGYMDSQSGVGFSLGMGALYRFGPWTLSIAPTVKNYSLIAFHGRRRQRHLFTGGASLSLAYSF